MDANSRIKSNAAGESLAARQERLETELLELKRTAEEQRERIEWLEARLSQVQTRATLAYREAKDIQNSRIWQTLVKGGAMMLSARERLAQLRNFRTSQKAAKHYFEIVCDSPVFAQPRSGIIELQGWALSERGIDKVEVIVGDTVMPARYGLYRPDLAVLHPSIAKSDRCGYLLRFDSTMFPGGEHAVCITASDGAGEKAEIRALLMLDHTRGYPNDYTRWMAEFGRRDEELVRRKLATFTQHPLVSILLPVYKTKPSYLERAIRSVSEQSYSNWELCIVDDCSQAPEIDRILREAAESDPRIRFQRHSQNSGISAASNTALAMAQGDYVALLDHDDELYADALFHMVDRLHRTPDAGILYSDEDHINESGGRSDPFFKPDWSPYLILSENYVCHFMMFRRELALAVGGFRTEADTSQDHDILLRMSLKTDSIVHVPRILYHWRTEVSTRNRASDNMENVLRSSREAVENYLREARIDATVEPGRHPGRWRVRYKMAEKPNVSVIMPCGGKMEMISRCVESIEKNNGYPNYEYIVVDNSKAGAVKDFVQQRAAAGVNIRHLDWRNRRFNYSAMNNDAVAMCQGPLLLFLNDDTSAIEPDWMEAMAELAVRPDVGAVGARLLFPDDRIQHAGVVVGIFGAGGHCFKGAFSDDRTYFDFPDLIRDVSAVTAACCMTRKEVFEQVGGFDAIHLPVAYNDVDLCLKIRRAGYRIVYTPHATLYHYEAVSKAPIDMDPRPEETRAFRERWREAIGHDPFYNPNLTLTSEDYSLKKRSE